MTGNFMDMAELSTLMAITLGVGWASGINLYAAVLALGLAGSTGYADLPPGLDVIENPLVIAAAGLMYLVEFCADKVPGVDSVWDTLHTFIRLPAGALLAAGPAATSSIPDQPIAQLQAAVPTTTASATQSSDSSTPSQPQP